MNQKHGHATGGGHCSPTYLSWCSMKQRCLNPKHVAYSTYGGRGIRICSRWLNSFENFLADMGVRPRGMTLDRKKTNGNYTPLNSRWATLEIQNSNRRRTIPTCHPKEKHWANGLCRRCYERKVYDSKKRQTKYERTLRPE
jgi:hypothetical protein